MADYQLTAADGVIRNVDGAWIPNDPANRDWIEYQQWLADGGVPDPYVPPPDPTKYDPTFDMGVTMHEELNGSA